LSYLIINYRFDFPYLQDKGIEEPKEPPKTAPLNDRVVEHKCMNFLAKGLYDKVANYLQFADNINTIYKAH